MKSSRRIQAILIAAVLALLLMVGAAQRRMLPVPVFGPPDGGAAGKAAPVADGGGPSGPEDGPDGPEGGSGAETTEPPSGGTATPSGPDTEPPPRQPGGGTLPSGTAGAPAARPAPDCPRPGSGDAPPPDIIITGAMVVDGTGAPARRADVAVAGACIVAVGRLDPTTAARVIDATGLLVTPGFINPHSHTWDPQSATDPDGVGSLLQGLTTEVGGVDGRSGWPIGKILERLDQKGTGVNYMTLVGQGTVRGQVIGTANRRATPAELDQMKALVAQAMAEGAAGLSTGLEYVPGRFGNQEEVTELARVAAAHGGIYSTHMRSEGDRILEGLQEALAVGQGSGAPVSLSHFKVVWPRNWSKFPAVLDQIAAARAAGQEVFADVYPYTAPDYATHRPLTEGRAMAPPEYLYIKRAADGALVGKTVAQAAQERGWDVTEAVDRLLAEDRGIIVTAEIIKPDHVLALLAADFSLVGTDGGAKPWYADAATALQVHPRSYGSYPRVLRWQREGLLPLSLEATVRKMSGAAADHLRLHGRGYAVPGYYADLVVLDPVAVTDLATWESPQQYSVGVRDVLVNGVQVVESGQPLRIRAGRVIRYAGGGG